MRNSVKATVDAYDGTVTLYEWDEDDPILKAWSEVVPRTSSSRKDGHPGRAARAPALPRGPVQGAALPVRALPRHRREDVLRGQRPLGGPEDPEAHHAPAAAVPPLHRHGCGRDVLADLRLRAAAQRTTWPRSCRSTATRPARTTARSRCCSCPTSHSGGPRRSPTSSPPTRTCSQAAAAVHDRATPTGARQPADAAGRRRAAVRAAALHQRSAGEANYPMLQFVLVSYEGNVGIGETLRGAIADFLSFADDGGRDQNADSGRRTEPDRGADAGDGASRRRRAPVGHRQGADPRAARRRRGQVRRRPTRPRRTATRCGGPAMEQGRALIEKAVELAGLTPIWARPAHPGNVLFTDAGWSSSVARWAHNPEVAGSNPAPATNPERPSQSDCEGLSHVRNHSPRNVQRDRVSHMLAPC